MDDTRTYQQFKLELGTLVNEMTEDEIFNLFSSMKYLAKEYLNKTEKKLFGKTIDELSEL